MERRHRSGRRRIRRVADRSVTSGKGRVSRDDSAPENNVDPSSDETSMQSDWEMMMQSWAERELLLMAVEQEYPR
jgi:hypothetical protein